MSNLNELLHYETLATDHMSLSADVNSAGRSAFFSIPLISNFAERDVQIGLLIPCINPTESGNFSFSKCIPFLWGINVRANKGLTLYRNGLPDCFFIPCAEGYYCEETGELISRRGLMERELVLSGEDGISYVFREYSAGYSTICAIEFQDGFKLFVQNGGTGIVSLVSPNIGTSGQSPNLVWHADYDYRVSGMMTIAIYRTLDGIKTDMATADFRGSGNSYTITTTIHEKNVRSYVYRLASTNGGTDFFDNYLLSLFENGRAKEWLRIEQSVNISGQIDISSYQYNRGKHQLSLVSPSLSGATTVVNNDYSGYRPRATYSLASNARLASGLAVDRVTSNYGSDGFASSWICDERGRIVEIAKAIPFVKGGAKSVIANGYFEVDLSHWSCPSEVKRIVEDDFLYSNLVGNGAMEIPAGKSATTAISRVIQSRESFLFCGFAKSSEIKGAKLTIILYGKNAQIVLRKIEIDGSSFPFDSYLFFAFSHTAKMTTLVSSVSIENSGTTQITLKALQLLPNYVSTKIKYDDDAGTAVSYQNGQDPVISCLDAQKRPIYIYGESESGEIEYVDQTKRKMVKKTTDLLGRTVENAYVHLPKNYILEAEGNWRIARALYLSEGLRQEAAWQYDESTWLLTQQTNKDNLTSTYQYDSTRNIESITGNGACLTYSYDTEGNVVKRGFSASPSAVPKFSNISSFDGALLNGLHSESGPLSGNETAFNYDAKGRLSIAQTKSGFVIESFSYNSLGEVEKITNGTCTTQFVYDDFDRVSEISDSSSAHYKFDYGGSFYKAELVSESSTSMFYLDDGLMGSLLNIRQLKCPNPVLELGTAEDRISGLAGEYISNKNGDSLFEISPSQQYFRAGIKTLLHDLMLQGFFCLFGDDHRLRAEKDGSSKTPTSDDCDPAELVEYIKCVRPLTLSYAFDFSAGTTIALIFYGASLSIKIGSLTISIEASHIRITQGAHTASSAYSCESSNWNSLVFSVYREGNCYICFNEERSKFSGFYVSSAVSIEFGSGFYAAIAVSAEACDDSYCQEISRHYRDLCLPKAYSADGLKILSESNDTIYDSSKNSFGARTFFIPLNGFFITSQGSSPLALNINDDKFQISKRSVFEYSPLLGRLMFLADGTGISYSLGSPGPFTISMKAIPFACIETERYLFGLGFNAFSFLNVVMTLTGVSVLRQGVPVLTISDKLSLGQLSTISLSYSFSIVSSSSSGTTPDLRVSIRVNGKEQSVVIPDVSPTLSMHMRIGSEYANDSLDVAHPFYGLIGDVMIIEDEFATKLPLVEKISSPFQWKTSMDVLGRPVSIKISNREGHLVGSTRIQFKKYSLFETSIPSRETISLNDGARFLDDALVLDEGGRLLQKGSRSFRYDSLGRITVDSKGSTSISYDNFGNVSMRTTNGVCYQYSYFSDNRLSSVNSSTYSIVYAYPEDHSLYPNRIIRTSKGTADTITLKYCGNRLSSVVVNGAETAYAYDAWGRRWRKTAPNGSSQNILYDSSGRIKCIQASDFSLLYGYSSNGLPRILVYTSKDVSLVFLYVTDILGTILGLTDENGNLAVEYGYDTYGKPTVLRDSSIVRISEIDPLKFKGYFYDSETGFYYLLSRYYDPETGRFISPDHVAYLKSENPDGLNLYVYCGNDPINKSDPNGRFGLFAAILLTGVITGFTMVAFQGVSDLAIAANTGNWDHVKWQDYVGAFAGGFVGGALSVVCPNGLVGSLAATGISRMLSMELQNATGGAHYSTLDIVKDVGLSMLITTATYGLTYGICTPMKGNNPFKTYSDLPYLLGHGLTQGVEKNVARTFLYQYTVMSINMGLVSSFGDFLAGYRWKDSLLGAF